MQHGETDRSARPWIRRMVPRDPEEPHRAATPIELLFDLCFVVAVAEASAALHHGLGEGHVSTTVFGYLVVFFTIWWAWMNFTWFASAYDTDDVAYRLKAFLQIAGGLVVAAGTGQAFEHGDFRVVTIGYTLLRIGLVAGWLRAANADPARRTTALRYAAGLTACQLGWISLLALPSSGWIWGFAVFAPAELLVPIWAESAARTPWHARHVAERHGLFTVIVLGESVLATSLAIRSAFGESTISIELLLFTAGAILILLGMWWTYFDEPAHAVLVSRREAFVWGYGHLPVFASAAAVGAGLAVAADAVQGRGLLSPRAAGLAVAIPVAVYLLANLELHVRKLESRATTVACLVVTLLVLVAGFAGSATVPLVGLALAGLVVFRVAAGTRASR